MDGKGIGDGIVGAFYTLIIGGLIAGIVVGAIGIKIIGWILAHLQIGWN